MSKIDFEMIYHDDSKRVVLMNDQLGYGAKLMMDVFNVDTIRILTKEFLESRFNCLFYPPFLIADLNDDVVVKEVDSLVSSILTGPVFREFILKARALFSYFGHDPLAEFSNHSDYYRPIEGEGKGGDVSIVSRRKESDSQFFDLIYRTKKGEDISFSVQCFTVEGIESIVGRYDSKFPSYLLYKKESCDIVEDYILRILSEIRYSSRNELVLKLATFSYNIDVVELLSIPIAKGEVCRYSIKH